MSNVPAELLYTSDHEWVSPLSAEGTVRVGITDHAQDALGDVVYVDLPSVGDSLDAEGSFGEIESTKSVSDLLSPVAGEVVAVNEALADDPILTARAGLSNFVLKMLMMWQSFFQRRPIRLSWTNYWCLGVDIYPVITAKKTVITG